MDDAWLHSFTTTSSGPAQATQQPQRQRGSSLLQQPAEQRADVSVAPRIVEELEKGSWNGPPNPTLARRAQSYSDFYDAVTRYSKKQGGGRRLSRKNSLQSIHHSKGEQGTELEFDSDFVDLECDLLQDSHATYTSYAEQLQLSHFHLDSLLVSTNDTLRTLSALSASFQSVDVQTETFRKQCESLITEQRRIQHLSDALSENAAYYTYLEPVTRRLNAPGAAHLVKGRDFPEMLSNLDNCLEYMEGHPNHKESGTYRSKYRLLLTRALTLIRHHFTNSLGEIANDITTRIQGGDKLTETTHSALLYAKFRVPAPELKALGVEIQKRAKPTLEDVDAGREPEYMSLMRELYQTYSAARGRLILPLISRKMSELTSTYEATDLLGFSRANFSFMKGIMQDEYNLWFEWFEVGTETGLYEFVESLMEPMYDYLRPRTIHETRLEKLCELCAMIQDRYVTPNSDDEDEDDADGLSSSAGDSRGSSWAGRGWLNGNRRPLDFASLVQPALEDAQTRLVFLALNSLREGIEGYKPKPEDLKWPKDNSASNANSTKKGPVLSGTRDGTRPTSAVPRQDSATAKDDEAEDFDDSLSMLSKQMGLGENVTSTKTSLSTTRQWYPPLRKAIWLLRRIYRLVNSTVFDDLAHRIVHSTTHSILYASTLIAKTPPSTSSEKDGEDDPTGQKTTALLFTILHLLHLKQQIVNFDIEITTLRPEVEFDFSSVTNTFYELRDRGSLWNPAGWVRLVGGAVVGGGLIPKVVENMLDAKAELDAVLRTQINEFVNACASHITAPIEDAGTMLNTAVKPANNDGTNIRAERALKATRTVRGLAEKNTPLLRSRLNKFFPSSSSSSSAGDSGNSATARTRETLIAAVRDQVVLSYEDFFDIYTQGEGVRVSKKGKGREGEVWGPEVFAEGMARVFAVGEVDQDESG
ncbi:Sec34-domain-containing protein [Polychaeton citri CBS 116435]|uniref:Conserved oligomeric Golgi complex subunit 3 n=1 Tax=Polychaeton citri CBS 116435 TaxID=1314669 RepID=A0A9P4UKR2_9PEZI|nr:Sec34-domain-containing protein [Polychaeton citri CBS 116435]